MCDPKRVYVHRRRVKPIGYDPNFDPDCDVWWCRMGKIRGKWNIVHYPESLWPKSESIAKRQNPYGDWLLRVVVPICTDITMHPVNWQRKVLDRIEFLVDEGFLTPYKDKRVDMRKFNFRGSVVE